MPQTSLDTITFNDLRKKVKGVTPLHPKKAPKSYLPVAGASPAQLTYRNGPLLANVDVISIYWGSKWLTAANQNTRNQLDMFLDYLVTSPYMDQLKEYSVPAYQIGYGTHSESFITSTPIITPLVLDLQIKNFLKKQITNGIFPQPTVNSLYVIFTQPGVVVQKSIGVSCVTFCGYHDQINRQLFYAVIPYPSCASCHGSLSTFDALTTITSHEFAEAITDPIPGSGWYDNSNGEIGDICPFQTKQLASYTVQKEWSNASGVCL